MGPSRLKRRRKIRRIRHYGRLKKLIRGVVLLVITVLSLYHFTRSSFFSVQQIEAHGIKHLQSEEVIRESGVAKGMNLFQVDTEKAQKRLLTDPLVDGAKVRKHLPNRVVITIQERTPVALLLAGDAFLVVDSKGYCLEKTSLIGKQRLPIITGCRHWSARPGSLASKEPALLKILEAIDSSRVDFFSEFNIADGNQIVAYSRDGTPVLLGTTEDLSQKLRQAVSIAKGLEAGEELDYIDVRTVQAPAVKYRNGT